MKAIYALLVAALFILPLAAAQEPTAESEPGDELITGDGGITPDNPLYGLDVAFDNIALTFTWNPEAKAKLGLKIAEERLLEAKTMAERGRPEAVQAAQEQYRAAIQAAEQAMAGLPEDADNATVRAARQTVIRLQNEIENLSLKVALVIDRVSTKVLAKAPEPARPALEAAFTRIKAHIANMSEKIEAKKANIKLKLRALENRTEQEIENETEEVEQAEGLVGNRTARAEIIRERLKAKFENLTNRIESLNISEQVKMRIIEKIEAVKERIEDVTERAAISDIVNVTQAMSAFGQQVSELAQQIRTGNITAPQLVAITTAHSEEILARIREANKTRAAEIETELETELPEAALAVE